MTHRIRETYNQVSMALGESSSLLYTCNYYSPQVCIDLSGLYMYVVPLSSEPLWHNDWWTL